jgi:RHS repeat-associated protein
LAPAALRRNTRTNGTAAGDVTSQTVWSAAYINAPILQDSFSNGTIQPDSRIYFLHDANWDTTAVVGYDAATQSWGVVQRYVYSPYGSLTILKADFSTPPSGTVPMTDYLYQGMSLDPVTGLYYERFRDYSPSLGVWVSQDPAGYINGANTYQFEVNGPLDSRDPNGLTTISVEYNLTPEWLDKAVEDIKKVKEVERDLDKVEEYIPGVTGFFSFNAGAADVEASIKGTADVEDGTLCSASLELEAQLAKIKIAAGLQASADLVTGRVGLFVSGDAEVDISADYTRGRGWDFSGGGKIDVKGGIFGDLTGANIVRVVAQGGVNLSYGFHVNSAGELTGKGEWNYYGALLFQHRSDFFWGSWETTYTYTLGGQESSLGQLGPYDMRPYFEAALSAAGA